MIHGWSVDMDSQISDTCQKRSKRLEVEWNKFNQLKDDYDLTINKHLEIALL